jgi:hypothetical protein
LTSGLVRPYDLTMPELALAINQDTTSTTVLPLDARGRIRGRAYGKIR